MLSIGITAPKDSLYFLRGILPVPNPSPGLGQIPIPTLERILAGLTTKSIEPIWSEPRRARKKQAQNELCSVNGLVLGNLLKG